MTLKSELISLKNLLESSAYNYKVHFCTPEPPEAHQISITENQYQRSLFETNSYTNKRTQVVNFICTFYYSPEQDVLERIEQQSADYNNLESAINTQNQTEGFQYVIGDAEKTHDEDSNFHLLMVELKVFYRLDA